MTTDAPKPRGGRAPTGTVLKTRDGRLQAQVTFADGTRKRLKPLPPGTSEAMAEERTLTKAREALELDARKATPAGVPAKGCGAEWWERYLAHREARGLSSVMHIYRPHIAPVLFAQALPVVADQLGWPNRDEVFAAFESGSERQ